MQPKYEMHKILRIKKYTKKKPIKFTTRTKFGGQPDWIDSTQWPLSAETRTPMSFIGQIDLAESVFQHPNLQHKMAYIFMTDSDVDGTYEPRGGENAVIIQSNSSEKKVKLPNLLTGPTYSKVAYYPVMELCQVPNPVKEDMPSESSQAASAEREAINFLLKNDIQRFMDEDPWYHKSEVEDVREVVDRISAELRAEAKACKAHNLLDPSDMVGDDDKIKDEVFEMTKRGFLGGEPSFIQDKEFPEDPDNWIFLVQIPSFSYLPFEVPFGDAGTGYAFINKNGLEGVFLWQCY